MEQMKSLEVVQEVSKELKENGFKVNQEQVKATIKALENTVSNAVLEGKKVRVLGVNFSSKEQKGREGVITVGTRAGEAYKTEDKIVPTVKFIPSKKAELTRAK